MTTDEPAPRRTDRRTEILFVCVHNAGRSQMAAAFTRQLGGNRVDVRSGGSAPRDAVHPVVLAAMREVGLDLATETPRKLADADVRASDVVITMGCGDACPIFPGRRYEDWTVPDPAGCDLNAVRAIRDNIRARVVSLLASI